MSHIVTIRTQLKDPVAMAAACRRLQLPEPRQGTAGLFSGQATGWLVQLPGWEYPVVIDTTTGNAQFDNYAGAWGDQRHLNEFLQTYVIEKCRLEASRKGLPMTETRLPDGSVRLEIVEGES